MEFHPVAFDCFRPFSRTRFGPGPHKRAQIDRVFALQTQQSYGKRVTWAYQKWTLHFGPLLGPEKRPKQPVLGHWRKKPTASKFPSFYPLEFSGLIQKWPGCVPLFAENLFSPAEFLFTGLVVWSCHFDVTGCAEPRQLAQTLGPKGPKGPFGTFQSFWPAYIHTYEGVVYLWRGTWAWHLSLQQVPCNALEQSKIGCCKMCMLCVWQTHTWACCVPLRWYMGPPLVATTGALAPSTVPDVTIGWPSVQLAEGYHCHTARVPPTSPRNWKLPENW